MVSDTYRKALGKISFMRGLPGGIKEPWGIPGHLPVPLGGLPNVAHTEDLFFEAFRMLFGEPDQFTVRDTDTLPQGFHLMKIGARRCPDSIGYVVKAFGVRLQNIFYGPVKFFDFAYTALPLPDTCR